MKIFREPLVQFFVIGTALFSLYELIKPRNQSANLIDVTPSRVAYLSSLWETQNGRQPDSAELRAMIDEYVREEILFREATRLRLDEGDTIIRRRMAQKMAFMIDDLQEIPAPTEDDLRAYYYANKQDYMQAKTISFDHIFFPKEASTQSIEDLRRALNADPAIAQSWRQQGAPFIGRRRHEQTTHDLILSQFGAEFSVSLNELSADGKWYGPIPSSFGDHLIRIRERKDGAQLSFEETRENVLRDVTASRRVQMNEDAFLKISLNYEINMPASLVPQ